MTLSEWEAHWERHGDKMRAYYASNPQARAQQRARVLERQARGEFRYRKYTPEAQERCRAMYLAGVPMPELLHKLCMARSTLFRICRGLRRQNIKRDWGRR